MKRILIFVLIIVLLVGGGWGIWAWRSGKFVKKTSEQKEEDRIVAVVEKQIETKEIVWITDEGEKISGLVKEYKLDKNEEVNVEDLAKKIGFVGFSKKEMNNDLVVLEKDKKGMTFDKKDRKLVYWNSENSEGEKKDLKEIQNKTEQLIANIIGKDLKAKIEKVSFLKKDGVNFSEVIEGESTHIQHKGKISLDDRMIEIGNNEAVFDVTYDLFGKIVKMEIVLAPTKIVEIKYKKIIGIEDLKKKKYDDFKMINVENGSEVKRINVNGYSIKYWYDKENNTFTPYFFLNGVGFADLSNPALELMIKAVE